ncbi:universal stress protein [Duganella radicis]|uniref:Universal stress protein n=1 Tax=Duganella radicis TaxID=551988 RepID=A0A6L6PDB9_9BURK|nr:universal stress protein [Duganella radicis]MTV36335.1 universal stress protein [Duganella radicis]
MSYKTILVHVDQSPLAPARIELAARLTRTQEAHLIGAGLTGITMAYYRNRSVADGGPLSQRELDQLKQGTQQALERFEAQARGFDISHEARYSDDEAGTGLALQARYADLIVLSQAAPETSGFGSGPQLPEMLALHGGRPLLIVPYAGTFPRLDRHALIAWDGSRAATRALTDALPLLQRSARVTVAVFNSDRHNSLHGGEPGADIALYLTRHGVNVEVMRQTTVPGDDVGGALLSLAADIGADLLVMGAYGHQRWREILLGGVTRHVLRSMTLPVLMSH